MIRPFEELWKFTESIYGAFTKAESMALYNCAVECGSESNFVEIGCYCGRSSSILAMVAKDNNCDFVTVDNFITGAPGVTDVKRAFANNMTMVQGKYNLMAMKSENAARKYDKEIDLLFVDGDHRYVGVTTDMNSWLPKVKPGGYVLFHDYNSSWSEVKKAVDEYPELEQVDQADSMSIRRYKP